MKAAFTSLLFFFPFQIFGFGSLAEFISPDGNTLRTNVAFSTDLIGEPAWAAGSVQLELCTGGSYGSAPIAFKTSGQQTNELLQDIDASLATWAAVAGGPSFPSTTSNACNGGHAEDGHNRISFVNSLSAGILAVTTLHETVVNGIVTIQEADIEFNNNYLTTATDDQFSTNICNACLSGCPAQCPPSPSSHIVSFQGVLTHELGHFLGLSHSWITDDNSGDDSPTDSSVATMFPSISSHAQSRIIEALADDDILGKKNLYMPGGFPNFSSEGVISGTVKVARGRIPFRGAHIYAFDITNRRSIAGIFTGMSGTLGNSTGTYSLKGIPFNTPFIVVAEPVNRPELSISYEQFNNPIAVSLDNQNTGLRDFVVEAYPDAPIVDIRLTRNSNTSPGISAAQIFTLTSGSPQISGIDFNLSENVNAPNDAETLNIAFNSDTQISNANPLQINLSALTDLSAMPTHSMSLTATKDGRTYNWSAGIPSVSWSGTNILLSIDPREFSPGNGVYSMTFNLNDSKFGTFSKSATVSVSNWSLPADFSGDSGGGGCSLQPDAKTTPTIYFFLVGLFLIGLFAPRKFFCRNDFV